MRNGQNKRMRGRNRNKGHHHHHHGGGGQHHNPLTRVYESNGPDVKIRGTPHHVAEKYLQLARDAASSGDHVTAENHYQHAEHYFRLIAAAQEQFRQQNPYYQPQAIAGAADTDQDGFEGDDQAGQGQPMQVQPMQGQPIPQAQPNYGNQPQPQYQPQPYSGPQQQGRPHYQQQQHNQQQQPQQQPRHQPPYEQQPSYQQQPPQQRPHGQPPGVEAGPSAGADALPAFITGVQQPQQQGGAPNMGNGYDAQGDRFQRRRRRHRGGGGPRPDMQQGGPSDFRDEGPDDPRSGNN